MKKCKFFLKALKLNPKRAFWTNFGKTALIFHEKSQLRGVLAFVTL